MLKWSWILFIIWSVAMMAVGGFITRKVIRKPDTAIVLDTLIVYNYKDTTIVHDTVITAHDTVFIKPETPIAEIPVRTKIETDSLPIMVGKQIVYAPYSIGCQYRGVLYKMWLETHPKPYEIELVKESPPIIDFYGQLAVSINVQKELLSEVELGVTFWNKASLGIGVRAWKYPVEATAYVGLKYMFF